jgi:hypothetical protein
MLADMEIGDTVIITKDSLVKTRNSMGHYIRQGHKQFYMSELPNDFYGIIRVPTFMSRHNAIVIMHVILLDRCVLVGDRLVQKGDLTPTRVLRKHVRSAEVSGWVKRSPGGWYVVTEKWDNACLISVTFNVPRNRVNEVKEVIESILRDGN